MTETLTACQIWEAPSQAIALTWAHEASAEKLHASLCCPATASERTCALKLRSLTGRRTAGPYG